MHKAVAYAKCVLGRIQHALYGVVIGAKPSHADRQGVVLSVLCERGDKTWIRRGDYCISLPNGEGGKRREGCRRGAQNEGATYRDPILTRRHS